MTVTSRQKDRMVDERIQAVLQQNRTILTEINAALGGASSTSNCIGVNNYAITNVSSTPMATPPANTRKAVLVIEPDSPSTNPSVAIRFTCDGTTPVTGATANVVGVPVGDYGIIRLDNSADIIAFKAISADATTKRLKVLYYD